MELELRAGMAGLAQAASLPRPQNAGVVGKSSNLDDAGASPRCPQCNSAKLWKDGLRYQMFGEPIQRWLCRDCGLRFSDPNDVLRAHEVFEAAQAVESKTLKSNFDIPSVRQICVSGTKNLVAEQKIVLEVPQKTKMELKGAIVDFTWILKKENKSDDTITAYGYALLQLVNDADIDLFNPQDFLEKMPKQIQWTETRKHNLTKAYNCFLNHNGIKAELPKYKLNRPLPYIPPEEFLDQLIACGNQMMAAFLQTLKETAARPGEAWAIEWDELDVATKKIRIDHPEKGCNSRIRPISDKLLNMLLGLPRIHKRIFIYKNKHVAGKTFRTMRKRAIRKLGNPELRKIDFYTYRYFKATETYWRTRDFGEVMVLLGHKSLRYVLLYAQLSVAYYADKGYICKEAHNRIEAAQLIEAGFEFVVIMEGVSLFRKLK